MLSLCYRNRKWYCPFGVHQICSCPMVAYTFPSYPCCKNIMENVLSIITCFWQKYTTYLDHCTYTKSNILQLCVCIHTCIPAHTNFFKSMFKDQACLLLLYLCLWLGCFSNLWFYVNLLHYFPFLQGKNPNRSRNPTLKLTCILVYKS